ncbi:glycosyltransferase family 4 protein [Alteribacter natronophilus]|uniref:glycosyltransferase family 4 protein n=1 Tax=Alteribacter natronophilus TaxID=2583810 RepID=UPI00110F633D|nr:glycosyltransferase family 4 protein [Alteribacter natronophilus]TMW72947.1 glycosyltransferase family 4 protein [Alteribacter natronophilus]
MKKKAVLICTESLPAPAVKGGAIQMFIDGTAPFAAAALDLTVCSITDPSLPENEVQNGIRYVRFPKEVYTESVAAHLTEEDYDFAHVFNRPLDFLTYADAAPRTQFVLGLHNDMLAPEKISAEDGERVIESAAGIVTISNFIRKKVTERFPEAEGKTRVVYSGVDLGLFPDRKSEEGTLLRNIYRKRYGVENRTVVLFAGRLSRNKGPHILMDALIPLLSKYPDLVLMVAGGKWFSDDGMNRYTRKLQWKAAKLKGRVIFTGFVPAHLIGNLFLAGDIFVCPSLWEEPLARVHYEAMAAGIPVITTDRGGNGEVVLHRQNAWLISDCMNPVLYTEAIDYCLQNPSFTSVLTENGRTLVETAFQFRHAAERLLDAWRFFGLISMAERSASPETNPLDDT